MEKERREKEYGSKISSWDNWEDLYADNPNRILKRMI